MVEPVILSDVCCVCNQTYEEDMEMGGGVEWVQCPCSRWLHQWQRKAVSFLLVRLAECTQLHVAVISIENIPLIHALIQFYYAKVHI